MIAKVEPLTRTRALRGPFDYRLPPHMGEVGVGSVLVVPFARRRLLGVVVDVARESELPPERLAEPYEALDQGVPAELVRLGLWVAEEYCSTPARGLALVLPPGTGRGEGPRVRARRELTARATPAGRAALAGEGGRLGTRQRAVLEALVAGGPRSAAGLARGAGGGHATLRSLEARGLAELTSVELRRAPRIAAVGEPGEAGRPLTPAQAAALSAIVGRMDGPAPAAAGSPHAGVAPPHAGIEPPDAGGDRRLLLHGVTGSGKTEVYLRAAAAALERGRSAIVLVPEIALTPQTASRFERRFGEQVAILHSRLRPGERRDEWVRLRRGQARVCVGARSAIFAPVRRLGLVVIDEEHDASYKQEGDPRYDARRVAERRAAEAGAVLVAGSATPRPESVAGMRQVALPARVDGRGLPPVELVSMASAQGALHERTREALDQVRRRGEKAVVLLNRRGWSAFVSCRGCGRAWGCPACDVSLALHRAAGRIACHHCGHAEPVPAACPDCGSVSVARHGAGTERLEDELGELVAPLPVLRLDADTAGGPGGVAEVLRRFEAAPAGVLLGTQMVAKGHDFPAVTLGVALDADATLRFPDFRAEERTFALVGQLAGRSGRGARGGRVIVQALDPGARALRHAAGHDAGGFLAGELERRRALRYPPYAHLVRVVCTAREPGAERRAAAAVADRARAALRGAFPDGRSAIGGSAAPAAAGATVLGPAPLFRLKGRHRAQVMVKAAHRAAAVGAVRGAVEAVAGERAHRAAAFSVDVDPH